SDIIFSNDKSLFRTVGRETVASLPSLSEFAIDQTNESFFHLQNRMEFDEESYPFQQLAPSDDPEWFYVIAFYSGQFYMASFTQDCPPSPPSISSQSDNVGAIVGGVIGSLAFIFLIAGIGFFFSRRKKQSRVGLPVELEMTLGANDKWL